MKSIRKTVKYENYIKQEDLNDVETSQSELQHLIDDAPTKAYEGTWYSDGIDRINLIKDETIYPSLNCLQDDLYKNNPKAFAITVPQIYCGQSGTFAPICIEDIAANSVNYNICGLKVWLIVDSNQMAKVVTALLKESNMDDCTNILLHKNNIITSE